MNFEIRSMRGLRPLSRYDKAWVCHSGMSDSEMIESI